MKLSGINLTLTLHETQLLHKFLGNFSDIEFQEKGISGIDREIFSDIYNELSRFYQEEK